MIRNTRKIDRRRKPTPRWEPPPKRTVLEQINDALRTLKTIKRPQ